MRIIRARPQKLSEINDLIARSKAHWDWPQTYLQSALPLLKLAPSYLRDNACFEAVDHAATVAFFSLCQEDRGVVLDNLWVEPTRIRQGVGRQVWAFITDLAKRQGWPEIWVLPDPPSEEFYLALGFADTNERFRSRVEGGPIFSLFRANLATVDDVR